MNHTHIEQSFSDEVMTQIPEAKQVLQDLGINRTHTRLQIQAEASSLDTDWGGLFFGAYTYKKHRRNPQCVIAVSALGGGDVRGI